MNPTELIGYRQRPRLLYTYGSVDCIIDPEECGCSHGLFLGPARDSFSVSHLTALVHNSGRAQQTPSLLSQVILACMSFFTSSSAYVQMVHDYHDIVSRSTAANLRNRVRLSINHLLCAPIFYRLGLGLFMARSKLALKATVISALIYSYRSRLR